MATSRFLVSLLVMLVAAACAAHAQERIKMCGRELVRLAVTTCGNSRLRRSLLEVEPGQHQTITPHWDHDAAAEAVHIPAESEEKRGVPSPAPLWYRLSSRIRRATGRISDICCEKGCSLKELIQFC